MKAVKSLILAVTLFAVTAFAQTEWKFDKSHSNINFVVTHMVITEVEGSFNQWEGSVVSKGDGFEGADVNFTVDVASIDTDEPKRDDHLRSDDFFNSEEFPKMTFKGKSMKKVDDNKYKLVGDLTIRDVTKEVELDVKYNGTVKDPWGNTKAGFKLTGTINRFDYNLKWNKLLETGGLVVSEDVDIVCNIQLVKS